LTGGDRQKDGAAGTERERGLLQIAGFDFRLAAARQVPHGQAGLARDRGVERRRPLRALVLRRLQDGRQCFDQRRRRRHFQVGDLRAVRREHRAETGQLRERPRVAVACQDSDRRRGRRAGFVEEEAPVGREARSVAIVGELQRAEDLTRLESDGFECVVRFRGVEDAQVRGQRRDVVACVPGKICGFERGR
jgi:hypothetical protein